ncbi:MAG: GAF domain-containing protein, partial [Planctomycetes bacterium]|nr:GAF domain-containing protein [Planctomycetota bacterium]
MPRIVVLQGPDAGRAFELPPSADVGTDLRCAVPLLDRTAPPCALRLARRKGETVFKDLTTIGAVSLNGRATRSGRLKTGDLLKVGQTVLIFSEDESVEGPAAAEPAEPVPEAWARLGFGPSEAPMMAILEASGRPPDAVATLLRIGERVRSLEGPEEVAGVLLDVALEAVPADRGAVVLFEEERNRFRFAAGRARGAAPPPDKGTLSRGILVQVMKNRESLWVPDTRRDERFERRSSLAAAGVRSVLAAPLLAAGRFRGAIVLESLGREGEFTEEHLRFLSAVGLQGAMILHNQELAEATRDKALIERELELAGEIQRWMLANTLPHRTDVEVFGTSRAAH